VLRVVDLPLAGDSYRNIKIKFNYNIKRENMKKIKSTRSIKAGTLTLSDGD